MAKMSKRSNWPEWLRCRKGLKLAKWPKTQEKDKNGQTGKDGQSHHNVQDG